MIINLENIHFSSFEQLYAYWVNTSLLSSFTAKFSEKLFNWVKSFVILQHLEKYCDGLFFNNQEVQRE